MVWVMEVMDVECRDVNINGGNSGMVEAEERGWSG